MKYQVIVKKSNEGVSVNCPALPGCWSEGTTELEALKNIEIAIEEYSAAIREANKGRRFREIEVAF